MGDVFERGGLAEMRKMDSGRTMSRLAVKLVVLAMVTAGLAGCWRPAGIGVGGKYNDAIHRAGQEPQGWKRARRPSWISSTWSAGTPGTATA